MSHSLFDKGALVTSLLAYEAGVEAEDDAIREWNENDDDLRARLCLARFFMNQKLFLDVSAKLSALDLPAHGQSTVQDATSAAAMSLRSATDRLSSVHDLILSVAEPYAMAMLCGQLSVETITADLNTLADTASSLSSYQQGLATSSADVRAACTALRHALPTKEDVQTEAQLLQRALLMRNFTCSLIIQCESLREGLATESQGVVRLTQQLVTASSDMAARPNLSSDIRQVLQTVFGIL